LLAADGCDENIPDTASFNKNYIQRQMLAGYCECDRDHMDAESCTEAEVSLYFKNKLQNTLLREAII